jgi:hypothetical protein
MNPTYLPGFRAEILEQYLEEMLKNRRPSWHIVAGELDVNSTIFFPPGGRQGWEPVDPLPLVLLHQQPGDGLTPPSAQRGRQRQRNPPLHR